MVAKTKFRTAYSGIGANPTILRARAFEWMVNSGTQAINMSFGSSAEEIIGAEDCDHVTSQTGIQYCDALSLAEEMDVVMVASAGNRAYGDIEFPASDPRVLAIGAIDTDNSVAPWLSNGPEKDFIAPGISILSTFYEDRTWNVLSEPDNPFLLPECADYISGPTGYGPCSGTSMSAPFVTGIVGILRSVNPLLKKDQIKEALINHASHASAKNDIHGYGLPDVLASVEDILGVSNGEQMVNRVTPLFSLTSTTGQDSFYTTSPQMAMAAMYGAMQPQPSSGKVNWHSTGPATPGYNAFPKPGFWWTEMPHASVYIFTTHNHPFVQGSELVPLYRLSFQGTNGSNNLNVDHTYATEQSEVDAYKAVGYKLDGIEGYIFPRNEPQPTGTVRLYRKYNPTRDDHAIFPETQLSYMASQGYTQNSGNEWIGYVYPNQDGDYDGLIDGFELVLGTNISDRDSDNDGVTDGIEINSYPNSDPMVP